MGRRHIIKDFTMFDEVQLDQNQVSIHTDVEQVDKISFNVQWTTDLTPFGSLKVMHTNDLKEGWKELVFGQPIAINNTDNEARIEITVVDFKFIRLEYDWASGDGVLSAQIHGSSVGA